MRRAFAIAGHTEAASSFAAARMEKVERLSEPDVSRTCPSGSIWRRIVSERLAYGDLGP